MTIIYLSEFSSRPGQIGPDTYSSFRDAADEVVTLAAGADVKQGEEEGQTTILAARHALNPSATLTLEA